MQRGSLLLAGALLALTACASARPMALAAAVPLDDGIALTPPEHLSETGLCVDPACRIYDAAAVPVPPDGPVDDVPGIAVRRFRRQLATGATRSWAEIWVGDRRVETRMITRVGTGYADVSFATYVWDADGRDATIAPLGVKNVLGTGHDVPSGAACWRCHVERL